MRFLVSGFKDAELEMTIEKAVKFSSIDIFLVVNIIILFVIFMFLL